MPRNDAIRTARAAARAETQELIASLRQTRAEIATEREAYLRERAGQQDAEERARRRGDRGPDLQRVQRRIDAGVTTWEDVVAGRDDAPESRRVVATIHDNLDRLGRELAEDDELTAEGDAAREIHDRLRRFTGGH